MRIVLLAVVVCGSQLPAQSDSLRPKPGAEVAIPLVSLIPGMGQYIHGEFAAGLRYSAQFATGFYIVATNRRPEIFPLRDKDHQFGRVGDLLGTNAMFLSSWDAFHRSVPALQQRGKYDFLPRRESIGSLATAPFDGRFLGRWTTWAELVPTALVTSALLVGNGTRYPLHGHDVAYASSMSMGAAVGEEALFRGYLLPMLYQKTGRRFWLANMIQGTLFWGLHGFSAPTLLLVAPSGYYQGWVTKRNGWSVRESIFAHFWYDVALSTAAFAFDRDTDLRVTFPTIRF